jgi:hypothetical protein
VVLLLSLSMYTGELLSAIAGATATLGEGGDGSGGLSSTSSYLMSSVATTVARDGISSSSSSSSSGSSSGVGGGDGDNSTFGGVYGYLLLNAFTGIVGFLLNFAQLWWVVVVGFW